MDFSVVILLSLVCIVDAYEFRQRCLLFDKKCVSHCPRQMHPYHTRCDGNTMSQRTCGFRRTYILGYTCGWSRCDCNGHMLLDEESGFCVDEENCPIPLSRRHKLQEGKRNSRGEWRLAKTFKLRKYEDTMDQYIRDTVHGKK